MTEEWVDEDKLDLWEVRQYGEKADRGTPITRASTGKLPQRNVQGSANAAELKDKMEQQLREQRAAHQQKRALEMSQGILPAAFRATSCIFPYLSALVDTLTILYYR